MPFHPAEPRARMIHWGGTLVFNIIATIMGIPLVVALKVIDEPVVGLILILLYLPIAITSTVLWAILHYKCWKAIPERFRSISAGRAVGFMFIPLFNFYWVFVSFTRLADDLASWQRSMGYSNPTRVKGLAVTHGILFVLSFTLGLIPGIDILLMISMLIIFIILYSALVGAINRAHGHT